MTRDRLMLLVRGEVTHHRVHFERHPRGWAWSCDCRHSYGSAGQYDDAEEDAYEHVAEALVSALEEAQPDHIIQFDEDGWTIQHSLGCRLTGRLLECEFNEAARTFVDRAAARRLTPRGRFTCVTHPRDGLTLTRIEPANGDEK